MIPSGPSFRRSTSSWLSNNFPARDMPKLLKYESLKTCTSRRWLFNEDAQMALRKLDFNVEALGNAAVKASGATKWTDMNLLAEGTFNRVLRISLNNGQDVAARLSFPNAGPRRLMTSSEVATMDFLRIRLAAPVPKVLAWNASFDNDVGIEYIIMEMPLGKILPLRKRPPHSAMATVVKLMNQLAAISFSQYGSIYYKEDVDPSLQARPLYADPELHDECSDRFRIGPIVDRQFYRGGRAHLPIDRGPWTDALSYLKAAVDCEVKWIETYSNTPSARNQPGNLHIPDDHISVLDEWLQLAPAVLPDYRYCVPKLFHPNILTNNILRLRDASTDPTFMIIDWQGAAVRPLFETLVPQLLSPVSSLARLPELVCRQVTFDPITPMALVEELKTTAIDLFSVLNLPRFQKLRELVYLSSHSWSDGLALFEHRLIGTAFEYGNSIPINDDYPFCPLSFTEKDEAKNIEEVKPHFFEQLGYLRILGVLEERGISFDRDGSVALEDYEKAKTILDASRFFIQVEDEKSGEEMKAEMFPPREGQSTIFSVYMMFRKTAEAYLKNLTLAESTTPDKLLAATPNL